MKSIHAAAVLLLVPVIARAAPFDGAYSGGATLSGGDYMANGRCPPGSKFGVKVQDGVFNWRSASGEETSIHVAADGSFAGQNGARFITGKIAGTALTAEVKGQHCYYTWSLTR